MADLSGSRLGQYEILELVGEGGMAAVYRAHQTSINRDVAIKVIKASPGSAADFRQRFEREAHTVAQLNHLHILKVFDYGQQDDVAYLVMELHTGGSLADLLHREQLSLATIGRLLGQVASALDFAHRRGIVHRDLKPQNILIDTEGNAILTDFGLAKLLTENTSFTMTGVVMGTPSYMAPEQWQGIAVDSRADIYALGIILFEMLTQKPPFEGVTAFTLMHKHVNEPPPSLKTLRPDLPSAYDLVISKALEKHPEARFGTAGELSEAFNRVVANHEQLKLTSPVTSGAPTEFAKTEVVNTIPQVKPRVEDNPVSLNTPSIGKKSVTPLMAPAARSVHPVVLVSMVISTLLVIIISGSLIIYLRSKPDEIPAALAPTSDSASYTPSSLVQPVVPVSQTSPVIVAPTSIALLPSITSSPSTALLLSTIPPTRPYSATSRPALASTDMPLLPTLTLISQSTDTGRPTSVALMPSELRPSPTSSPANTEPPPTSTETLVPPPPTKTLSSTSTLVPAGTSTTLPNIISTASALPTFTIAPATATYRPTSTATPLPPTSTVVPSASATLTSLPPSKTPTRYSTSTLTPTFTATITMTPIPTQTALPPTNTHTPSSTFTPTVTATMTASPTLTRTPSFTSTPTITATIDARGKIVYHRYADTGNSEIFIANPDGTGELQLTRTRVDNSRSYPSPDGRSIAFTSTRDGNPEIYVMNIDGTNQTRLTNDPGDDGPTGLAWSPDSKRIIFSTNRDKLYQLYIVGVDGVGLRHLLTTTTNEYDPAWSPDGQLIAFTANRSNNNDVYVMNADGTNQRRITTNAAYDGVPGWSPDGKRLLFISNRDGQFEAYVMNANGSSQRRVTQTGTTGSANWSLDGQRIIYTSGTETEHDIFTCRVDGSDILQITNYGVSGDYHPNYVQ